LATIACKKSAFKCVIYIIFMRDWHHFAAHR
jgi:hypothetical protein